MDLFGIYVVLFSCFLVPLVYSSASRNLYLDEQCDSIMDMDARELESLRLDTTNNRYYHNHMDCTMSIKAPKGKLFEVKILENSIVRSTGCEKDYLQIIDGPDMTHRPIPGLEDRICGSTILKTSYTSTSDRLIIRFISDKFESSDGFRLLITAFREDPNQNCMTGEFQCQSNKRCISKELVCDYYEDCADGSDDCSLSTGTVIGIAVGSVVALLTVVGIASCCCCFRKTRPRTGSTKHLSYESSDPPASPTSLDDIDYSEIHYFKPPSVKQAVYTVPSVYSTTKSDPYVISNGSIISSDSFPENLHRSSTKHVYITAPPEETLVPVYSYH